MTKYEITAPAILPNAGPVAPGDILELDDTDGPAAVAADVAKRLTPAAATKAEAKTEAGK